METIIIDDQEWFDKYKPIAPKKSDAHGSYEFDGIDYSWHLDSVQHIDENCLWTVTFDDNCSCICQGFHFVNRDHYLVTSVPYVGGKETYVRWADEIWEISHPDGSNQAEICGWDESDALEKYCEDYPNLPLGQNYSIKQIVKVI